LIAEFRVGPHKELFRMTNLISSGSDYQFGTTVPHTNAYLAPVMLRLCRELNASRILDIGCGNGALLHSLTALGVPTLVGCDPSASGVDAARQTVPTATFYQLGVYDDPHQIQAQDFDVAIATEVVEHLFYPRALPRFAHAKLKPGGHLVLSTPYHGFVKNLALSVFNKWDDHHTPLWDGGHIKFWSKRTLTQMLEQEGFRFERFIGCGRLPYLWMSMVIVARKI
jgi:2-polyprenyl-3-methyl-5-hydroxy-6-metoxy-1,4-benzoquinol methylase